MEENIKQVNEALARVVRSEMVLITIRNGCDALVFRELSKTLTETIEELVNARIDLEQVRYRLNEARNVTL